MKLFGSGLNWATPLTDATGAAIANPSPLLFGVMQDIEFDIKFELKKLHGQNQFAVAIGRGKGEISGKAKLADIRAGFLETIIFGASGASGLVSMVYDTVGTVAAATVTVTPPNSGTFAADLGVISSVTGRPFTRVASAPVAGQYTVTAGGAYGFAAADVGIVLYINYRYTATSTTARKMTIVNNPMGYTPRFRCDYYAPYDGQACVMTFNNCTASGIKLGGKNDDFTIPEVGFDIAADQAGIIGTLAFTE
ncbi:MAG: hypothetical protein RJA98_1075 [Pseudomonadota bacterium]|jgi:hypothetical protein